MKDYQYYRLRILDASPACRERYLAEAFTDSELSTEELDMLTKLASPDAA